MSLALYQISNQYQQRLDTLEDYYNQDECEHSDEAEKRLWNDIFSIEDALEDKAIAVASYIKNLEAELDSVTLARKDMQERESRLKNSIENKRKYLLEQLQAAEINEIKKSPNFVIKIKKNPPSVDVTDEALIPKEYIVVKQVESISKAEILKDLKDGLFIPGVTIKQTVKLEIK